METSDPSSVCDGNPINEYAAKDFVAIDAESKNDLLLQVAGKSAVSSTSLYLKYVSYHIFWRSDQIAISSVMLHKR